MDAFRVYLRGELGKLRNPDHARELLNGTVCRLSAFGLPETPEALAAALRDQAAVNVFVETLSERDLVALVDCYEWRNNGVPARLRNARTVEYRSVPVGNVTLSDAEPALAPVFIELYRRLESIATDSRVLAFGSYGTTYGDVAYSVLLAEADPDVPGNWRVFDGVFFAGDRSKEPAACEADWHD